MNSRKHLRNLLQIVVGGSGAGKSRYVVKPNVMLANASYIVTDPKGELLRACGGLLLQEDYTLRVFDLIDPANSNCFNPFTYIRKDSDVFRLIDNFIKNTTPKNSQQNDPFWEKSEIALDAALMWPPGLRPISCALVTDRSMLKTSTTPPWAERSVTTMIKTLVAANKSEKVPFKVPKTVQQSIPIEVIYPDGIWQVGMKHSKTWRFSDINYGNLWIIHCTSDVNNVTISGAAGFTVAGVP